MTEVIIAARGGPDAKQRCATALSPIQRAALTRAMLGDMIDAARRTFGVTRIWVVTPTAELATVAAQMGASVILEPEPRGLTAAFDRARRAVARLRPDALLVMLPGDLPLIDAADLQRLIAACGEDDIALVPAQADGGTGALVMQAAAPFAFACGPDSFARHQAAARAIGLTPRTLDLPGLAFDLDRPHDIPTLLERTSTGRTRALLTSLNAEAAA